MGKYVNENLGKNENVFYETKLHWIIFVPGAILCLILIGVFFLLEAWIRSVTSEYVITNERIIMKDGFIKRRTLELRLSKIESVGLRQGILGRIFNYGSLVIIGTGGTRESFDNIANPAEFRKKCNELTSS